MDTPVCILGLGLIGGSLLRALAPHTSAFGYNRSATTVDAAGKAGFDVSDDLPATLRRAAADDALIVVATPAMTLDDMLSAIAEYAPTCALTDVVSVKGQVARQVDDHGLGARFVGGHPMAGTAESGWEATDPELFWDAIWVVAADDGVDPAVWTQVADLAQSVGARVVPAGSDDHDRAVAGISHLPHLTAAVTAAVGIADGDLATRLAAGSFRDGTRVAGTAPQLQQAMLEANASALLNALTEAIDRLTQARDELRDNGTVHTLVADGHRARKHYENFETREIAGIVIGEPGWEAALRAAGKRGEIWTG